MKNIKYVVYFTENDKKYHLDYWKQQTIKNLFLFQNFFARDIESSLDIIGYEQDDTNMAIVRNRIIQAMKMKLSDYDNDYICYLDPDERLSYDFYHGALQFINVPGNEADIYTVNIFSPQQKTINDDYEFSAAKYNRIFQLSTTRGFEGKIHERLITKTDDWEAVVKFMPYGGIEHLGYDIPLPEMIAKVESKRDAQYAELDEVEDKLKAWSYIAKNHYFLQEMDECIHAWEMAKTYLSGQDPEPIYYGLIKAHIEHPKHSEHREAILVLLTECVNRKLFRQLAYKPFVALLRQALLQSDDHYGDSKTVFKYILEFLEVRK